MSGSVTLKWLFLCKARKASESTEKPLEKLCLIGLKESLFASNL